MQPFYPIFNEEVTDQQIRTKVLDFFLALAEEPKNAFLEQIRAEHGEESYDLLKNYSVGLKGFPVVYQLQVVENIASFLSIEQVFELIRLECKLILQRACTFGNYFIIKTAKQFTKLFLAFVQEVEKTVSFDEIAPRYKPYKAAIETIGQIERMLLLQKLGMLYEDICVDIEFISHNLMDKKNSLEDTTYRIPCLKTALHIAYIETDSKGNEEFVIPFSIQKVRSISNDVQTIVQRVYLHTIDGKFKDILQNYITEQTLQQEYQQQSTSNTLALAQYDAQNVLETYKKSSKLWQTMKVKMELQLRVGELKTGINTATYRKRIFILVASILGGSVWLGVTWFSGAWFQLAIGLVFMAMSIYNFFKPK